MARVDPIIERMFQQQGRELVFQAGSIPWIRTHSGNTSVLRQAVAAPQIISAIAELISPEELNGFPKEGTHRYNYESPAGAVVIQMDKHGEKVRASIQPVLKDGKTALPTEVRVKAGENLKVLPPQEEIINAPPPPPTLPFAPPDDPGKAMAALLEKMVERKASDLHLASKTVPMMRVDGDMESEPSFPPLTEERLKAMLWSITPEKNQQEWTERKDTDFAHETVAARFRVNVFADRKGIGAVLRQIPTEILSAEKLGLSQHILDLCSLPKGLILVTGPTGSGKSTTLASMLDHINRNRTDHIITIEDPIEFVHENQKCLVNQREVGVHTGSFKAALRAALREDPDVVLVGELRDLETISIAIETAETGHLVFGTLHTNTAPSTVSRIIDQFPADRQDQVRQMLSESLKGVVAQTLCKKIGGGRVAAQEVLLCTPSVSNLIREGKTFQIPSVMQTSRGMGMQTLNDALFDLVKAKQITSQEAMSKSLHKSELKATLDKNFMSPDSLQPSSGAGSSAGIGLKIAAGPH